MRVMWVGVAGAAGAVARYLIGRAVGAQQFPWATLAINVSGSFILAFVVAYATARHWSLDVSTAIPVGLGGSYATFSTFMWESFGLGRTDRVGVGPVSIGGSSACGLMAAWGAYRLAQ